MLTCVTVPSHIPEAEDTDELALEPMALKSVAGSAHSRGRSGASA